MPYSLLAGNRKQGRKHLNSLPALNLLHGNSYCSQPQHSSVLRYKGVETKKLQLLAEPGEAVSALTLAPRQHRNLAKPDPKLQSSSFCCQPCPVTWAVQGTKSFLNLCKQRKLKWQKYLYVVQADTSSILENQALCSTKHCTSNRTMNEA